jgi:hypothetical protein
MVNLAAVGFIIWGREPPPPLNYFDEILILKVLIMILKRDIVFVFGAVKRFGKYYRITQVN